mmetsp:Transcript_53750/g.107925  ORF Transcript_53750/g.107925 Transcript_53750/m.107925 type:complete len:249 (-) Transcript_53750:114-860(-)
MALCRATSERTSVRASRGGAPGHHGVPRRHLRGLARAPSHAAHGPGHRDAPALRAWHDDAPRPEGHVGLSELEHVVGLSGRGRVRVQRSPRRPVALRARASAGPHARLPGARRQTLARRQAPGQQRGLFHSGGRHEHQPRRGALRAHLRAPQPGAHPEHELLGAEGLAGRAALGLPARHAARLAAEVGARRRGRGGARGAGRGGEDPAEGRPRAPGVRLQPPRGPGVPLPRGHPGGVAHGGESRVRRR